MGFFSSVNGAVRIATLDLRPPLRLVIVFLKSNVHVIRKIYELENNSYNNILVKKGLF